MKEMSLPSERRALVCAAVHARANPVQARARRRCGEQRRSRMSDFVRPAASPAEFFRSPVGTYLEGRRHAVFVVAPDLMGFTSWGRPDVDDVRELLRWCEVGLGAALPPHRFLVDIRTLESIEPATFTQFVDYVRRNRAALAENITKQAQLRPDGLVGAIIGGFAHIARPPYPERVFVEPGEGLEWLGVPADHGHALLAELEAIRSVYVGRADVVGRLRRLFETRGVLALGASARALSLSPRSLQRALRSAGTTYVTEARAFRIARAQELLQTTDRHLGWIAIELGFSSSQHFATEFRRAAGLSPSAWRSRLAARDRGP